MRLLVKIGVGKHTHSIGLPMARLSSTYGKRNSGHPEITAGLPYHRKTVQVERYGQSQQKTRKWLDWPEFRALIDAGDGERQYDTDDGREGIRNEG
jgi:hypothetical protein